MVSGIVDWSRVSFFEVDEYKLNSMLDPRTKENLFSRVIEESDGGKDSGKIGFNKHFLLYERLEDAGYGPQTLYDGMLINDFGALELGFAIRNRDAA